MMSAMARGTIGMPNSNMKWEKSSEDLVEFLSTLAPKDAGVETEEDIWMAVLLCERQSVRRPPQAGYDLPSFGEGSGDLPEDGRTVAIRAHAPPQDGHSCRMDR
jgi:hypothetical protein